MASSIGTIFVDLKANTADFLSGMTTASSAARRAGRDIEGSFSKLGSIVSTALSPLGAFGSQIGSVFSSIGSLGASASQSLAKMSGGMSALSIGGGIAAGAIAAVESGAIALTVHTAENAAKMYELAQATGVSVETLSGFSFVAKQTGVDQEAMVKGLERLDKAIFAAATSAPGATNAFTRLGVSVRDAQGAIRPTEEIMADLAEKFAAMQDGPVKTALALQLFGKAGAALIPILNEGKDGIEALLQKAREFGVVMDSETAAASHRFKQTLEDISAQAEGLSLRLTRELLPALESISAAMSEAAQGKTGDLNSFIDGIVVLTKATIVAGAAIFKVFGQVGEYIGDLIAGIIENVEGLARVTGKLFTLDFSGAEASARDSLGRQKAIFDRFIDDSKNRWKDLANFASGPGGMFGPKAPWTLPPTRGGGNVDTGAASGHERENVIASTIEKLLAQETSESKLANSIKSTTSETIVATAAALAQQKIDELLIEVEKRNVRSKTEKISVTEAEKQSIRDIITLTEVYKAAVTDNKEAENFIQKTALETKSLSELAVAYGRGSAAVQQAQEAAKIAPFQKAADDLASAVTTLQKAGVSADLSTGLEKTIADLKKTGASADELRPLQAALDALRNGQDPLAPLLRSYDALIGKIRQATFEVAQQTATQSLASIGKAAFDLETATSDEEGYAAAVMKGTEAVRQFNIQKQLAPREREQGAVAADIATLAPQVMGGDFTKAPELAGLVTLFDSITEAVKRYGTALEAASTKGKTDSAAVQVEASLSFKRTQDEISNLELLRNEKTQSATEEIATTNLIEQLKVRETQEEESYFLTLQQTKFESFNQELLWHAKLYDANRALIEQWDQAVLKVGNLSQRWQGFINEIQLQGQGLGGKVFGDLSKTIDDLSGQIAKFVVTGKSNFQQLFEGLGEELLKQTLQTGIADITKGLFGSPKTGSQSAKGPLGTQNDPLYVVMAGAAGTVSSSGFPFGGASSSSAPLEGEVFGIPTSLGGLGPIFGGLGKTIGGSTPGILGGIGDILGLGGRGSNATSSTSTSSIVKSMTDLTKSGGSPGAPLYVIVVGTASSGIGGILGGLAKGGSGDGSESPFGGFKSLESKYGASGGDGKAGGGFGDMFKGLESGFKNLFSSIWKGLSTLGSSIGSIFSSLAGLFGGGRAEGGDVMPGKAYLVGEKHPELFMPGVRGTIVPTIKSESSGHTTQIVNHFHGVSDMDSFRRSNAQIMAEFHRTAAIAYSRTRG